MDTPNREVVGSTATRLNKRNIPCNVCGSDGYTVLFKDELDDAAPKLDHNFSPFTRKTYQIVKCDRCELVYTNPMPYLGGLYHDTADEVYLKSQRQRSKTAEKALQKILRFKQGGRLLDVGCSTGIFLDAASKYFDSEGVETSDWACNEAGKRHKVYSTPLSELNFKNRYDVVTLFGVIEHFEDPRKEISSIHNLMKPGGLLVIYTGDIDAWLPQFLGKRWWWYQGMHTFYFSRQTCRSLLEKCGFDVLEAMNHTLYFQLFSLAISINRYPIGRIARPILNMPIVRGLMVPLKISGEMLMFASKN